MMEVLNLGPFGGLGLIWDLGGSVQGFRRRVWGSGFRAWVEDLGFEAWV